MPITLLGWEGWEDGEAINDWTFSGATVTTASGPARTGSYHLRGTIEGQYGRKVLSAPVTGQFVIGFGYQSGGAQGNGRPELLKIRDSAGGFVFGLGNQVGDVDGLVRIYDAAHAEATTGDHVATASLPSGTWNGWVYLEVLMNPATGAVSLVADGQTIYSATIDLTDGNDNVQQFDLHTPRFVTARHDDVYWGEGSGLTVGDLLGPGTRIFPLVVAADGAHDGVWTLSTGTNAAALVDETPSNSDTDYISETTGAAGLKQSFTLGDLPASIDAVHAVRLTAHGRYDAVNPSAFRQGVRIAGTDYPGADHQLSAAYARFRHEWLLNPADSQAWEAADVNGMEILVETRTP